MGGCSTPCVKRLLLCALALLLGMALPCCGGDTPSGAGHSFAYTLVGNPDTLDPQLSENASAKTVLANLFEGLFVIDEAGNVQNGVTESCTVSEDGLRYSIKLRQDSFWYSAIGDGGDFSEEKRAAVTAMDFVFAFQRLFDPLYHSPYRQTYACLENAEEIISGEQDPSMIGVYARKPYELEIRLAYPNANLPKLLALTPAMPCSRDFFESTKGRYGLDEESVIGNGSFAMRRWLYDPYGKYNVIELERNPLNHEAKPVLPKDVTLYIEETDADAAKIFSNGATDCYTGAQNETFTGAKYTEAGSFSVTAGLLTNPDSSFGNPDIRAALSLALDRSKLPVDGETLKTAQGVIPPASTLLNKSLRELISEDGYARLDVAAAKDSLSKGLYTLERTELQEGKILVPSGLMDYEALSAAAQQWQNTLGIHLSVEEVPDAEYSERLANGDYALALYPLTGDDFGAASVLGRFLTEAPLGCAENAALESLLKEAVAAENLTDCVELYRKAEETILSDSCFIPLFYVKRTLVCKKGVEDVVFNPFTGQVRFENAKYFD